MRRGKRNNGIIVFITLVCLLLPGCSEGKLNQETLHETVEKHGIMEDGELNLEPLMEYYGGNPETIPNFDKIKYLVYAIYLDGEHWNYVLDINNNAFYSGCGGMRSYSINTTADETIPIDEEKKKQIYELLISYQVDTWDSLYIDGRSYDYSWVLALEFEDGTIARYAGDNDWDDKSPKGYSEFEQAWADLTEEWIKEYHLENPDQSIISSLEGFESGMKQVSENTVSNEVPTEE